MAEESCTPPHKLSGVILFEIWQLAGPQDAHTSFMFSSNFAYSSRTSCSRGERRKFCLRRGFVASAGLCSSREGEVGAMAALLLSIS